MWNFFKVFIEFVTILLLFYVLFFCPKARGISASLIKHRTRTPCIGRGSLNHWTTREVLRTILILSLGCYLSKFTKCLEKASPKSSVILVVTSEGSQLN